METTQAEKLAAKAVKDAKKMLGDGWKHVSTDIQWGLVAANILALFTLQDESIDSKRVVELTLAVEKAAREIMFPTKGSA